MSLLVQNFIQDFVGILNLNGHFTLGLFLDSADSTTINSIKFTKSHEVAAVTFGGQLKVWDLRQPRDKPGRTMLL